MEAEMKNLSLNVETKPKKDLFKKIMKQKTLIIMSIPFLIYIFIFNYLPLAGWLMAFQSINLQKGYLTKRGVDWISLNYYFQIQRS